MPASRFFVHPQGLCESADVGADTRIWAFAHVLPGARIGADCNICDHVFVENDVVVGDRVTVKCGVQLWDGLRVGDGVFIGPNASFSNTRYPISKEYQDRLLQTHLDRGASIGSGATVLPGLRVGVRAMVGAGAVVTRDVPPRAIVVGNPARIVGYVGASDTERTVVSDAAGHAPAVRGVVLHRLPMAGDRRLSADFQTDLPFVPARCDVMASSPNEDRRGRAARHASQCFVCVKGSVTLAVDDGTAAEVIQLDQPDLAAIVPPLTWTMSFNHSANAVLLTFASANDEGIEDYELFLKQRE